MATNKLLICIEKSWSFAAHTAEGSTVLLSRLPVVYLQKETVLHAQLLVPHRFRLQKHPVDLGRDSLAPHRRRSVDRPLRVLQQPSRAASTGRTHRSMVVGGGNSESRRRRRVRNTLGHQAPATRNRRGMELRVGKSHFPVGHGTAEHSSSR